MHKIIDVVGGLPTTMQLAKEIANREHPRGVIIIGMDEGVETMPTASLKLIGVDVLASTTYVCKDEKPKLPQKEKHRKKTPFF